MRNDAGVFSSAKAMIGIGAASLILFAGFDARAHGGNPRADGIVFEPGNPKHIVIRSNNWGIFQTTDGGKSWNYGCAELFGGSWSSSVHRTVIVTTGGRILTPNQDALNPASEGLSMSDDFCDWRSAPALAGRWVSEIAAEGADLFVVTADGSAAGITGQLYESSDDGDTWSPRGVPLPIDFDASSLSLAPSDPSRVYALGTILEKSDTGVLETSSDGGATWSRAAGQLTKHLDGNVWAPRIYGVHPTRPDVVFAWADAIEGGTDLPDDVWVTSDGGRTWTLVYESVGDLPGFTFSPDGANVFVAGPRDGIIEASIDDVLANGPSAFTKIFDGHVWGLSFTSDGLYAGNDDFNPNGAAPPFTLGVSHDGGHTFEKVMTLCDVTFASCAPSSAMASMCTSSWTIPEAPAGSGGYKEDYLDGSLCVALPSQTGLSPTGGGDGGCAAGTTRGANWTFGILAIGFGLGARRLRRRHVRKSRTRPR